MDVRTIDSGRVPLTTYLREVWQARRLVLTFARRDIQVKYAQSALGLFWVLLQPITGAVIFTVFFTALFDWGASGIEAPYFLFAFGGYTSWMFFSYIVQSAGSALLQEESLIKKVHFPKLILPFAKSLVGLVDYAVSIVLLLVLALATGSLHWVGLWAMVPAVVLVGILGLSIAIWLSALTIRYRDFHHIIPYIVNFGIWLTPIFFPTSFLRELVGDFIYINPMAGAVDLFRWSILGTPFPSPWFAVSFVVSVVALVAGIRYFQRIEMLIADYL